MKEVCPAERGLVGQPRGWESAGAQVAPRNESPQAAAYPPPLQLWVAGVVCGQRLLSWLELSLVLSPLHSGALRRSLQGDLSVLPHTSS